MHALRFLLIPVAVFISGSLFAQNRITLQEALNQKLVQIKIEGTGGYQGQCINLAVKNTSHKVISLEVNPGQIFASEDSSVQDLITTAPAYLALSPGGIKQTRLYTMCTQSSNMSPGKGEKFSLGNMAEGYLLRLAEKIARGKYQNSTAQSAIWAVANRDPIENIYGRDTTMVRAVAEVVSEARNIPLEAFDFTPRGHQVTSFNTSLEGLIGKHLRNAKLALYDKDGNEVRKYFEGRRYEPGFMQQRVGVNHMLGDSAELYLRLTDGDENILERQVFVNDSVMPLERIHAQAVMTFLVKKSGEASVGVYDAEDQLYFYVAEKRNLPEGFNRGTYIAAKHLPRDRDYFFKVKMDGETIAEQPVDAHAPEPVLYPKRTVSGIFSFKQDTQLNNVRLAIFDSEGRIKRLLYDIHQMNPGEKKFQYRFEHRDGPDAIFYIRLTDASGNILHQRIAK